jgi:DNA polymerase-3 subunit epsilon
MYLPNFLDGFDRLVAFDAETTGKRTPDAEFIRKQPFAWRAPGIIIELGFVEMLREGEGWRKGETWSSKVNPDGPIDPEAIKIHRIRPADLKNAPRFPTILPKVKDFVGDLRWLRSSEQFPRFDKCHSTGFEGCGNFMRRPRRVAG